MGQRCSSTNPNPVILPQHNILRKFCYSITGVNHVHYICMNYIITNQNQQYITHLAPRRTFSSVLYKLSINSAHKRCQISLKSHIFCQYQKKSLIDVYVRSHRVRFGAQLYCVNLWCTCVVKSQENATGHILPICPAWLVMT